MRARLLLIVTIVGVVLTVLFGFAGFGVHRASASGPPSSDSGRVSGGWFASASKAVPRTSKLTVRARPLQRAELAAVAATITAPPPPPPPPSVDDPGTFVFPANGPITSAFGRRWGRAHTGVDIDGATGSPIIAAQTGTVTLAGWKNGYGNTVMIDHGNGVTTLYAHQARISVRNGQRVDRGQVLGTVGSTGNVTAAHLHYEVIVDGVHRNPAPWLR